MGKTDDIAKFFRDLDKSLNSKKQKVESYIIDEISTEVPEIILSQISRGISPVSGQRFQEYSQSYKEAINKTVLVKSSRSKKKRFLSSSSLSTKFGKRIRPVNLKLSGSMLNSFFVKKDQTHVTIGFDSPLAYIHSVEGAGKSKVIRKLLPYNNEGFNSIIRKKIKDIIIKASKLFGA